MLHRSTSWTLCCALVLTSPLWAPRSPAAAGGATPVSSRISKVTVYSTSAQVTRSATVELEPGYHVLAFERLPLTTYENALGCQVAGPARILGITLDTESFGEPVEDRLRELSAESAKVRMSIEELEAERRVLNQKERFLDGIRDEAPAAVTASVAETRGGVGMMQGTLEFFEQEWGKLEARRLEIQRQITRLERQRSRLQAELRALRAPQAGLETRLVARVEVDVVERAPIRLDLRYLVDGVSWRPYYDARLDRANAKLSWSSFAEIRQTSGEDWEAVELSISTADPLRAAAPPALDPIYLSAGVARPRPATATALVQPRRRGVETLAYAIAPMEVTASAEMIHRERSDTVHKVRRGRWQRPVADVDEVNSIKAREVAQRGERHFTGGRGGEVAVPVDGVPVRDPLAAAKPDGNAGSGGRASGKRSTPQLSLAALGETATGSIFRIDRRESIPADDSWRRVTIAVHELASEVEILTVPRKSTAAYLRARCANQTGAPLLPGSIHMFTDGDYVGVAVLHQQIAPGAPLTLTFGRHDRVEVKHELVREHRDRKRKSTVMSYHYRTSVKSFDAGAHRLVVLDQVPVAQDSRIKVDIKSIEPALPSKEPGRDGTLRWELDLGPGVEQVFEVEYSVRFPKEWQLAAR